MAELTFGRFLAQQREELDLTVREFANEIGIAASYLCEIEKDRKKPFDDLERLNKMAALLKLEGVQKDRFFYLAGKARNTVSPDLVEYTVENEYISMALRTARDNGAGEKEWNEFVKELEQRKGK